jgi:hypothetical protein
VYGSACRYSLHRMYTAVYYEIRQVLCTTCFCDCKSSYRLFPKARGSIAQVCAFRQQQHQHETNDSNARCFLYYQRTVCMYCSIKALQPLPYHQAISVMYACTAMYKHTLLLSNTSVTFCQVHQLVVQHRIYAYHHRY